MLHLLALEQKRTSKKAHHNKSSGLFSSLHGTGRNSSVRYHQGRNGNNIGSLSGLFGRRKGRRYAKPLLTQYHLIMLNTSFFKFISLLLKSMPLIKRHGPQLRVQVHFGVG